MRLDITDRFPFADGAPFGDTGPYDMLIGRAHYAVDPTAPAQQPITDIALAPTGPDGLVHFAGDIAILRPADPARGSGRLFFDWGNRGNKRALIYFNDAPASNDPRTLAHAGNGYLMRRGHTVVWGAWQGDLLPGDGRMLLDLPVAMRNDRPVEGIVRVEYVGREGVTVLPLSGWASTRSHPVLPGTEASAILTRRRYADAPRELVPASQWSFSRLEGGVGLDMQGADRGRVASRENLHVHAGLAPGWIYELVYTGAAPLVLGLGHAAVRDLVSFLRTEAAGNPLAGTIEKAYGWGRSQTGRAIRDFIHHGFNADGQNRRVFDGLLPHVSGAGRLNTARFANLTVPAGQQHEDHYENADVFPFAYASCTDHLTGQTDAILKRPATDPLVLHTQTATEYWQRRGSLVHTDTKGNDLPVPETVRLYLWSGSQHAADPNMGAPTRGICQNLMNVVATSPLFRAMLDAMDAWATHATPPPASRIPTVADATLVPFDAWRRQFPAIPGVMLPHGPSDLCRLDYGPDSGRGILDRQPPTVLADQTYPILVPAVDEDGNEIAGVRAPMVAAPLATYTGWNPRARHQGHGALHEFTGSTLPLPDSEAERAATGDPRNCVAARYANPAAYVAAIGAAARALVAARLMLDEDVPRAETQAANWGRPRHDVRL
jgi:hypothetical protein